MFIVTQRQNIDVYSHLELKYRCLQPPSAVNIYILRLQDVYIFYIQDCNIDIYIHLAVAVVTKGSGPLGRELINAPKRLRSHGWSLMVLAADCSGRIKNTIYLGFGAFYPITFCYIFFLLLIFCSSQLRIYGSHRCNYGVSIKY